MASEDSRSQLLWGCYLVCEVDVWRPFGRAFLGEPWSPDPGRLRPWEWVLVSSPGWLSACWPCSAQSSLRICRSVPSFGVAEPLCQSWSEW